MILDIEAMFNSRASSSLLVVFIVCSLICVNSQNFPATANLSTIWRYSFFDLTFGFSGGISSMPILYKNEYACGFYSTGNPDYSSYFGIFIVVYHPQMVWSANRNTPVKNNSTLELTSDGDLVLTEPNGNVSWSTSSSGKSVVGMNLTEQGNLVLFDKSNAVVWESSDYPTDTMVPGQKLMSGLKLRPSVSTTNFTETGSLSLSMTSGGLVALIDTDLPQIYYRYSIYGNGTSYLQYLNGSISLFGGSGSIEYITMFPVAASFQFLRFGSDGHFRVYEWLTDNWRETADLLTSTLGVCGYPTVCGAYGICSDGQCSCPTSATYFKQLNDRLPNLGCSETTPLSCIAAQNHSFLELKNVTFSSFALQFLTKTDLSSCKNACLWNCSCRAAFFRYEYNTSVGDCNLQQRVLSMMNDAQKIPYSFDFSYNHVAYIKVVDVLSTPSTGKKGKLLLLIGALVGVGFVIGIVVFLLIRRNRRKSIEDEDEDGLDQVPGMPTRFKYEELRTATNDFEKKLGQGGFGSVFEGILSDGTNIAVKRLEGLGQIKNSFLAEVLTIGNIHHVNLVRLVGFCADKSHRLLVYEFMRNGSLEKWIFGTKRETVLSWDQRKKIILDIAKGLTYLHEECRQKIIHLDIKPQNILLDENFDAKVSDFGLSKLIDRDQSQVVTTMRGTPGYLAPEWLSATITEKVDVYSFGIVVLEIVSGRKIFDNSKNEEDMHLLNLFRRKAEEEKLIDMVDKDMQIHGEEAVDIVKLAAWCLQSDFANRPTMSKVVKTLESGGDSEVKIDYNFFSSPLMRAVPENEHKEEELASITPLLASVLSGPR